MPRLTSTRTYTTYFDIDQVDKLVGGAYKELASDYERRKDHVDDDTRLAIEARLDLLRRTWHVMLDRVP